MRTYRIIALLIVVTTAIVACAPASGSSAPPAAPAATATAPAAAPTTAAAAPTTAPAAAATAPQPTVQAVTSGQNGPVKVGSKDFTEELLLGEMYAQLLEANGVPVQRKLNLAGTQVAHEALLKDDIDVYPEYTGTGYIFILGINDGQKDPQKVYQTVASQYKQKWDLVWLDPAPMNDTNAIACTQAAVSQYNIKTLSDLSKAAPNIDFAAIPDFPQRPDGLKGLQDLYGGFQFKSLTAYDPGLKYQAVADGKAQCVIAFSTDAQIKAQNLVLIQDDKGLWPPYNVAPVIRQATLDQYPQVKDVLNKLAPLLTTAAITDLNYQVDQQKQEYATVAKNFLTSKGLIK